MTVAGMGYALIELGRFDEAIVATATHALKHRAPQGQGSAGQVHVGPDRVVED
jgi:hypothetical protein